MYILDIKPTVEKIFSKIKKKNPKQLAIIFKKIEQITKNPHHFKPLKGEQKGSRRVHIDKSFVLIYDIDEQKNIITILDFNHHDKVY